MDGVGLNRAELNLMAQKRGGKCLEKVPGNRRYRWQCKKGHTWDTMYSNVKGGSWCPKCVGRGLAIKDMSPFAASKGGKCLSSEFIDNNRKTLLIWECEKGHVWEGSFYRVQQSWCKECNQIERYKLTLKEYGEIAKKRGGQCLTAVYWGQKVSWECGKGHVWEAEGFKVKTGRWCPVCAGHHKNPLDNLSRIAKERGGRLLSLKYLGTHMPLFWECNQGHQWWARPSDVINSKSWCHFCAGKKTVLDMQELAKSYGGRLLSQEYTNTRTYLKWECEKGHIFLKTPQIVLRGHWCPECSSQGGEQLCREIFEELFKEKFPRFFYDWLRRPDTGTMLQLDGFCSKLGIAFEYNGLQHYKRCDFFHRKPEDFIDQKYRDSVKRQICKKRGIHLVTIPQIGQKINGQIVGLNTLKDFIIKKLREFKKRNDNG